MKVLELSDEQAAALRAKAAAAGLSLEDWLQKLAASETPSPEPPKVRCNLFEIMARCDLTASLSDEDRA